MRRQAYHDNAAILFRWIDSDIRESPIAAKNAQSILKRIRGDLRVVGVTHADITNVNCNMLIRSKQKCGVARKIRVNDEAHLALTRASRCGNERLMFNQIVREGHGGVNI